MNVAKTHAEQTSAADKSIGFDYQYYYFLFKLLKMSKGESVGLEVKDDIHTDLNNNTQILIQLKHTVRKSANGAPVNLTDFDPDLWKTVSNWCKVICDNNAGRNNKKNQLEFVKKTEFMLVTNKSDSGNITFGSICENPQTAKTELQKLFSETKNESIQNYIKDLLEMDAEVLEAFLPKIHFNLETDGIIEQCKDAILEKQVLPASVDELFSKIDSEIRQHNYLAIKNGHQVIITFDDFNTKCRKFFSIARSPDLRIKKYYEALPKSLEDQVFIKQLIDIGDIDTSDPEEVSQYTRYMLTVKTNLSGWQQSGDLTDEEVDNFNNEAKLRWRNQFKSTYRKIAPPDVLAREVLDEMRRQKLLLAKQDMGTEFSNGEYYLLSDIPEIGWLKNWENKYK